MKPTPAESLLKSRPGWIDGWRFTGHAFDRMVQMGVTAHDVLEVLLRPCLTRPSGPRYPEALQVWSRDRLSVVVNPLERSVVTVLWWTVEQYERPDKQGDT